MNTFTFVLTPNKASYFEVHIAGCRDISKLDRDSSSWPVAASTATAAVVKQVAEFDEQEMGYEAEHFRILPCAKGVR